VTTGRGAFAPSSRSLSGGFEIEGSVETAFELFSPLGEKLWVPGWNPEILHPPGATWERGLVFRTQEEQGEAVWVVTSFDRERHEVEYFRLEAGRYVASVRVRCHARGARHTEAKVTYAFVGLSEAGNREIEGLTQRAYEEKMKRWRGWIGRHLASL